MAYTDSLSHASFSIQRMSTFALHTLSTWEFLTCTLFFVSDMGFFAFVHTWAFLTFTLVYRHFCPLQKAQIPKSHKIVTIMLLFAIFPSGITMFCLIISIFEGLLTCFWHDYSPLAKNWPFLQFGWMYTTSHMANHLFQHHPMAPDESPPMKWGDYQSQPHL